MLKKKIIIDGVKTQVLDFANFLCLPKSDGTLKNESYNRVWKAWGGYCGALNTAMINNVIVYEKENNHRRKVN